MNNSQYLKVAISSVKQNSALFKKYFGNIKSENKNHNIRDFVTKVDKQIEARIKSVLKKNFPSHKIVGEELGIDAVLENDFVWIIDPIDGTSNYIHGLPFCCISLALWKYNQPILGVVYNPILGQLYFAEQKRGAFLNNKKIKTSNTSVLEKSFAGFGWGRNRTKALKYFPQAIHKLNKVRVLGSTALEICLVASGVYDLRLDFEAKLWDFAASAVILKEAGGKITDIYGKNINLNSISILSTNGKIHNQILKQFKKPS